MRNASNVVYPIDHEGDTVIGLLPECCNDSFLKRLLIGRKPWPLLGNQFWVRFGDSSKETPEY